jgi:transcriptional regulator with XRE-family HTH domain
MLYVNLDFIKERRIKKNITLQEMAEALGFKTATNYQKYEQGIYSLDANMLPILAKKLNCRIEDFFCKESC